MIRIVVTTDENGMLSAEERQILRAIADSNSTQPENTTSVEDNTEVQPEPEPEVEEKQVVAEPTPEPEEEEEAKPNVEPEEEPEDEPKPSNDYTEEELSQMSLSVLKGLLEDAGIDYDSFEGKNTNKKLRTLYLTGKWGDESVDDEEEANEEPTSTQAQPEEPKTKATTISADDIRKAMSLKRDKNRQGIMDIFAQYGASKVSDLKEEDYAEVYNAINAL